MQRSLWWSLAVLACVSGAARAETLTDMRRALFARGGAATPEGRAWGQSVARQAGDSSPAVYAAAPLPGYPGTSGTRVRSADLEAVRIAFPDQASARGYAQSYWSAVQQAGDGRFYPQYLEVRGNELVLMEGPALAQSGQATGLIQAARAGAPGAPDLVGISPQGKPRPLQGPGLNGAVNPTPAPPPAPQPAPPPANTQPANTQPANTGNTQPAADQPAAASNETGDANGRGWQRWYRGLTLDGVNVPRAGLRNPTLQRALGVAVEPYGTVTQYQGKSFVSGKVSHFGGPRDTGVTASETGAISGERLRSLNQPQTQEAASAHPERFYYAAMRYDYTPKGKSFWAKARLLVINPKNGFAVVVRNVDWGPNTRTKRLIDLSPTAEGVLGLKTDQEAIVAFADPAAPLGPVR